MKMKTLYNIRIMLAVMLLGIVAACEDDDKIPGASYDGWKNIFLNFRKFV